MSSDERIPPHWTGRDLPDLEGRIFVVTGANSGLGWETACALSKKNATVVMACRNRDKAESALERIKTSGGTGPLSIMELDLGSLASVGAFADAFASEHPRCDVLVNNAGIMALPYGMTEDGFERQLGVNHFGPFALTGLMLGSLRRGSDARVVTVSSLFHKGGKIHFDDLRYERRYSKWDAYAQSKLANLLFAFELQRRIDQAGFPAISAAAHPGYASTNLQSGAADAAALLGGALRLFSAAVAQAADMGALPSLYAAAGRGVRGGDFLGPDGLGQMRGHPTRVSASRRARDEDLARRLWEVSEEVTGVTYDWA